ncbi:MAG: stage III sporulation protein AF [Senegalia sp. (in: firmicutes)]|uniref:stage III sporulation protein AF n=1 Tax=Senegalia sp. (in: firmicutes) TaxID=1924098 RepID=UPI003F981195
MIDFLRGWIINIVIISIFIAILEAIIPNNSFKSYIKMIGGFLIIIALINPFINLLSNDINIGKDVFSKLDKSDETYYYNEKTSVSNNNNQVEKLYIENLSIAIDESIEKEFDYNVEKIDIELLESDEFKGEIESLNIHLNKEKKSKQDSKNDINIKKIEISNIAYDEDENENKIEYEDLKKHLKDKFNIEYEKIHITIS